MESVEHCDEETPREWLKLSLGGDLGSQVEDSDLSTRTSPKMFSCQICTRTFYSVKARCAHQKAHKPNRTEMSEARHKERAKLIDIAVKRSVGVQAHSFVQKPSREGTTPVEAKFCEFNKDCGIKVRLTLAEWPGSMHLDRKPLEELSDTE